MDFSGGEIKTSMGLDLSGFRTGMLQANALASLFPRVVSDFLANPLLGAVSAFKALAGAAVDAMEQVAETTRSVAAGLDAAGEAAQNAGVAVQALTSLSLVAKDSGVNDLGDAFKLLNRNAADAFDAIGSGKAAANQAAQAFAALGIDVLDASGKLKNSQQLFFESTDAINALGSTAKKTQATLDLFGRAGGGMVAFLSAGSGEIRRMQALFDSLGASVTESEAQAGDAFARLELIAGAALDGIRKRAVLPIILKVAANYDGIVQAIESASKIVSSVIESAWAGINQALGLPAMDDILLKLERIHVWVQMKGESIRAMVASVVSAVQSAAGEFSSAVAKVMEFGESLATGIKWAAFAAGAYAGVAALKDVLGAMQSIKAGQAGLVGRSLGGLGMAGILGGQAIGNAGFSGAHTLGDTVSGAGVGAMVGGPQGALVGAGIGLLVGGVRDIYALLQNNLPKPNPQNLFPQTQSAIENTQKAIGLANQQWDRADQFPVGANHLDAVAASEPLRKGTLEAHTRISDAMQTFRSVKSSRREVETAIKDLKDITDQLNEATAASAAKFNVIQTRSDEWKKQIGDGLTAADAEAKKWMGKISQSLSWLNLKGNPEELKKQLDAITGMLAQAQQQIGAFGKDQWQQNIDAIGRMPGANNPNLKPFLDQAIAAQNELRRLNADEQIRQTGLSGLSERQRAIEQFRESIKNMPTLELDVKIKDFSKAFDAAAVQTFRRAQPLAQYDEAIANLDRMRNAGLPKADYAQGVREARKALEDSVGKPMSEVHGMFEKFMPSTAGTFKLNGDFFQNAQSKADLASGKVNRGNFAQMYGSGGEDYSKLTADNTASIKEKLQSIKTLSYTSN